MSLAVILRESAFDYPVIQISAKDSHWSRKADRCRACVMLAYHSLLQITCISPERLRK